MAIVKALREKFKDRPGAVAVTGSTGRAASLIGGQTLHSFAAIGLAKGTAKELANKIKYNETAVQRWMETEVLIIDESEF
ncbi:hypothetical protein CALCODRAFT_445013 [Calocera cornea HHB12733]|uniref:ATP-dependent DNA helicase n=1 Tax=Calocera cornea HHB12733 TaxID=1353952 RepID=A0A165C1B3_9BASI|nr:hypothetical protein CALCODRAFT_445013 [Calocera cornea HHB12733]